MNRPGDHDVINFNRGDNREHLCNLMTFVNDEPDSIGNVAVGHRAGKGRTIVNKIDAVIVMVNQVCDNLLIMNRDVATHMVAIQMQIPIDKVEYNLRHCFIDLADMKLFVLNNSNLPFDFEKFEQYNSEAFDKFDGK